MAQDPTEMMEGRMASLKRRIAAMRGISYLVLFLERLLVAILPALGIAALVAAVAWFGLFRMLPLYPKIGVIAVLAVLFLVSLVRFRSFRLPEHGAVTARLESESGLLHQAIRVQSERPVGNDPYAMALWKAHQKRMAEKISAMSAGLPAPDLARRDPFALRAPVVLLFVIALSFSWSNSGGRLSDIWSIPSPAGIDPDALRIDAWITPPSYTGTAPVYLKDAMAGSEIRVPQHSELTIRMSGETLSGDVLFTPKGGGEPIAILPEKPKEAKDAAALPATEGGVQSAAYKLKLTDEGRISIAGTDYDFSLIPDTVPTIAFSKEPGRAVNGALEISYTAKDDYGVVEARAEIEPAHQPGDAVALFDPPAFPLDLPGAGSKDVKATVSRDLTEHPLSGKVVRVTLYAKDAAGHESQSESKEIILPARFFSEPLAGSIAEQRQVFSLDVKQIPRSLALSDAVSFRPEEQIPDANNFLLLQSVINRLKLSRSLDDLEETAAYYWDVARYIEDGDLSSAEKRLRQAQDKLSEALNRNASDQEIAQLMQELRQAMQDYLKEMAKRMQNNPDANQMANQNMKMLRSQDLENMLNQLENLARSGNKDAARQMLSQMQRMMNNMMTARPNNGQKMQPSPMREQIDKLGELMQKQQKLMEETHKNEQALRDRMQRGDPLDEDGLGPDESPYEQNPPGDQQSQDDPQGQEQQQSQGDQQSQEKPMTAEELRRALKDLKAQQDQLEKDLKALEKGLSKLGVKPPPGFGEAGKEMGDSAKALGKSQGQRSVDAQGRALEALRKGAGEMMQQMQQMMAGRDGQQGNPMPGSPQTQGSDPLGRRTGQLGSEMDDQVKVPDEVDIQRAREILDQIRRKLGEGPASIIEKEYLERLLDLR